MKYSTAVFVKNLPTDLAIQLACEIVNDLTQTQKPATPWARVIHRLSRERHEYPGMDSHHLCSFTLMNTAGSTSVCRNKKVTRTTKNSGRKFRALEWKWKKKHKDVMHRYQVSAVAQYIYDHAGTESIMLRCVFPVHSWDIPKKEFMAGLGWCLVQSLPFHCRVYNALNKPNFTICHDCNFRGKRMHKHVGSRLQLDR